MSRLRALLCCLLLPSLSGCGLGYYWQAARGQLALTSAREPVAELLARDDTDPALREWLRQAGAMLTFAHAELALPDNGSYRHYVELDRDYVVWNVFAAPALSLQPREWCYPVAGCVSYRGYFREPAAREFAAGLAAQGDDVYVAGALAYSTLGKLRDPLLSTMRRLPPERLAGLLFHELAHQRLYLPGDTRFNESYASAVERAGVERWLQAFGTPVERCRHWRWQARAARLRDMLAATRSALAAVYAAAEPAAARLAEKQRLLDRLRRDYQALRAGWDRPPYFDAWFGEALNNAELIALDAYDGDVPAFRALLVASAGDFAEFHRRAEALAGLPAETRRARLARLAARAPALPGPPPGCALSAGRSPPGRPAASAD